jgi:hypothetical protein
MHALTLHLTWKKTEKYVWDVFPHYPYNLALSPSDCHLFKPLEGHMKRQCLENNETA